MKVERRSCRQNIESTLFEWRDENRSCLKYENSLSGGNPHPHSHWHQLKTKESASVMYCVRQEMEHPKCRLQEAKSKLKKSFIAEH